MLIVGTISLILSVNPQPFSCLLTQDACDAIWHQYVVENFIMYSLVGFVSMILAVIFLFLGRTKQQSRSLTLQPRSEGVSEQPKS